MSLKKGRLIAAFIMLCVFVGIYMVSHHGWIPVRKAFLASQLTTDITRIGFKLLFVLGIVVLTAFLGRWYCAILCPAGLVQEIFTRIGKRLGLVRLGFTDSPRPANMLAVYAILGITGFTWLLNIIDPIGLFGRAMEPLGEFWRYYVGGGDTLNVYGAALMVALLFGIAFLVVIPLFSGRIFCDRVCPVGALLKVAGMGGGRRMHLDASHCSSCGKCERICPARCIDSKAKTIDAKRCLLCMDCIDSCPAGGITYAPWQSRERRSFLDATAAFACGGMYVASREIHSRFLFRPSEQAPILPPGIVDTRQYSRCVTCQACLLSCPVRIIRAGIDSRPVLDYDLGYCQYNCQMCSRSCPAGVFRPMPLEEKHITRIAKTYFYMARCVVVTQGTSCGACAEVCPTHAVTMREQEDGTPTLPDFDSDYCIGCGACYHVCPSEPRAFSLEGLGKHERALGIRPTSHGSLEKMVPPNASESTASEVQEFPF